MKSHRGFLWRHGPQLVVNFTHAGHRFVHANRLAETPMSHPLVRSGALFIESRDQLAHRMDTRAPILQDPQAPGDSRAARTPTLPDGARATPLDDRRIGAEPTVVGAASAAVPLTKFRAPHLRRDTVSRDAVVSGVVPAALEARLLLAQAPAGFGKTTILVQLTAALAWQHGYSVVWVSLDTEDNDANRLFAAICTALAPLDLPWSQPPAVWLAQLQEAGPNGRAALGPLLNALAGQRGRGIVLVLDDLHHINDPGAMALLDAFIDRLPPEACLFVGSRETPPLSLARSG